MGYLGKQAEVDVEWRKSEFVTSYPGGTRSYATGTLHRSSCRVLSVDARVGCYQPSHVYEITVEKFKERADHYGSGGKCKVCQICCADIKVVGHRMIQPPVKVPRAEKVVEVRFSMKLSDIKTCLGDLGDVVRPTNKIAEIVAALRAAK